MSDRIDIHDPIIDICQRLGLEPNLVQEILFTPFSVTATVYRKNDNGSMYLDGDQPATETRTFQVAT